MKLHTESAKEKTTVPSHMYVFSVCCNSLRYLQSWDSTC